MDPPDFAAGGKPSPTRRELQGPRPAPLKVSKDSHKIKKPPVAPPHYRQQEPPQADAQPRRPVIIYSVSPRVIHTTAGDFMDLVQRLTGPSPTAAGSPGGDASPAERFASFEMNPSQRLAGTSASGSAARGGDVSPAARLASIERTSPSEREKERERNMEIMNMVEGLDMGFIPGILSPAPATLAPVPTGFFSPEFDPHTLSWLNDLSPSIYNTNNVFVPSSPNLFSAPIVSPSPSSYDLLSRFLDF
ncbi:hypothetical protein LguiA_003909 [Lonicera macranthoides]